MIDNQRSEQQKEASIQIRGSSEQSVSSRPSDVKGESLHRNGYLRDTCTDKRTIGESQFLGKLPDWKALKVEAFRLGLDCNGVFKKLTEEQIEREFNYIGPDRMPEPLRVALSYLHVTVLPAVLVHDLEFVVGGSESDFHQANRRLKHNMKICLKDHRKQFTFLGYWWERLNVQIAYWCCEKYGYEGWNAC